MILSSFKVLRDPVTREPLVPQFLASQELSPYGPTGILKGQSRDFPVLGGVVVCREDLATDEVMTHAKEGRFARAAFEALKAETQSRRAALELLIKLRYPTLLHCDGSPYGRLRGPAGIYFRYRYSVPNVPSIIGVLSCLRRTSSKGGYLLDVGAGFGHFYRYCLHAYPAEKIVLLDHSLEALITASRFTDQRTLLVCGDAETAFPFENGIFSDITSFNAFQYLKAKERFLGFALEALDKATGTLWLSNNWNPKLTDQFFGPARSPSEWRAFCNSEKWRIFPEKYFAEPVLRGALINLAVQYVPQDDHPSWRCVTLVYSNASWATNNKFIPLNHAPKSQHLHYNSLYYRSALRNRLVKRRVVMKFWESHRRYYGFHLPEIINLPRKIDRRPRRGLQSLSENLVMVESLCPRAPAMISQFVSSVLTRIRERFGSLIYKYRLQAVLKPLLPAAVKATAKRVLDLQRTC